jgi:hypothetical protein
MISDDERAQNVLFHQHYYNVIKFNNNNFFISIAIKLRSFFFT